VGSDRASHGEGARGEKASAPGLPRAQGAGTLGIADLQRAAGNRGVAQLLEQRPVQRDLVDDLEGAVAPTPGIVTGVGTTVAGEASAGTLGDGTVERAAAAEAARERAAAANVTSSEKSYDGFVDSVVGGVSGLAHDAAGGMQNTGLPGLGSVATVGAGIVDDSAHFVGGFAKEGVGIGAGLSRAVQDPIGLQQGASAQAAQGAVPLAYNQFQASLGKVASGQEGVGAAAGEIFNAYGDGLGHENEAKLAPLRGAIADAEAGNYAGAAGRFGAQGVMAVLGMGELGPAGEISSAEGAAPVAAEAEGAASGAGGAGRAASAGSSAEGAASAAGEAEGAASRPGGGATGVAPEQEPPGVTADDPVPDTKPDGVPRKPNRFEDPSLGSPQPFRGPEPNVLPPGDDPLLPEFKREVAPATDPDPEPATVRDPDPPPVTDRDPEPPTPRIGEAAPDTKPDGAPVRKPNRFEDPSLGSPQPFRGPEPNVNLPPGDDPLLPEFKREVAPATDPEPEPPTPRIPDAPATDPGGGVVRKPNRFEDPSLGTPQPFRGPEPNVLPPGDDPLLPEFKREADPATLRDPEPVTVRNPEVFDPNP
jgi:hypothetical protein